MAINRNTAPIRPTKYAFIGARSATTCLLIAEFCDCFSHAGNAASAGTSIRCCWSAGIADAVFADVAAVTALAAYVLRCAAIAAFAADNIEVRISPLSWSLTAQGK